MYKQHRITLQHLIKKQSLKNNHLSHQSLRDSLLNLQRLPLRPNPNPNPSPNPSLNPRLRVGLALVILEQKQRLNLRK